MAEKLVFTLQEIALEIGVSKDTIRRRMENVKFLLLKEETAKRKRLYNQNEVEFIKSLFYNKVEGL